MGLFQLVALGWEFEGATRGGNPICLKPFFCTTFLFGFALFRIAWLYDAVPVVADTVPIGRVPSNEKLSDDDASPEATGEASES